MRSHEFILGDKIIRLTQTTHQPEGRIAFIQLHDDEKTAVSTALQTIQENGGSFITIENEGERNISFNWQGQKFKFDPNRIFTSEGRKQTLSSFRNYSAAAEKEVKSFAEFILKLVPPEAIIIAIHNNSNNRYSVDDYKKGRSGEALKVHINNNMDTDDFVFTTEDDFYNKVKAENISVVLQDNSKVKDDGSLSVYYGKTGRPYVNIEAEHGHLKEQSRMIAAIIKIINEL